MSNKTRMILIAIMLVAAVFLSGCVDDNSAKESQSSDKFTEKANSAAGQNNITDDKKMSVPEDIDNNLINDTATTSSFNVTNTTNNTSAYTRYSSGGSSSSGSSSKSSDSSETDTITVTDDLGRSITVPYPCERTVFLVENAMNTMYAVEGANNIVGIGKVWAEDVKAPFFKAIDSNYTVKKISNGTAQPSTETIATVNPQLVFLWASDWESADIKAIEETLNIPVYAVYIDRLDDLQNQITTFSKLIDNKEKGEKVIDLMNTEMDKVANVTDKVSDEEKPTVYWMWGDVYGTAGKISTANDLIERSGGINVIDEWDNSSKSTEHPVLNLETLLKLNPDVIYMWYNANLDPENITNGDTVNGIDFSDWSQLDAVKNGRVYEYSDHFVYDFHTPRLPLAMMHMAKDLYPTQFADVDLAEETDQYFVDIYGVHYPGFESTTSTTQTITDMAGREVTVPTPEKIQGVSCLHPIATYMTWRLAPEKLISIDTVFNSNPRLVPESANEDLNSLPVTGVYFKGMNQEQMLALDPDVIVSLAKDPNLDTEQIDYDAPIMAISKDKLSYYEQSFRLMGQLLGNEEEAEELAEYWNNSIEKVTDITSEIPEDQRLKVYYASHDGPLSTVGPKTVMNSIINLAGGVCMYDTNTSLTSADQVNEHIIVNIEQVLTWNPDMIITKTEAEKNTILTDAQWQSVNAVQNGRVYAAPRWESLDGMQSIMGLMWTAEKLYPNKVTLDFNNETKTFYSKFYLYDNITDEQIAETVK